MIRPPATGFGAFIPCRAAGSRGEDLGGDSWKYGAAASWLTGSYDVETNTLILGSGNPVPDYNADLRKGDNLYSDCILALDADTGRLKWYYQFTPNDPHDWDSTEDMVLADQVIDGKPRKLVLHADRNGFSMSSTAPMGNSSLPNLLCARPGIWASTRMAGPSSIPNRWRHPQAQVVFPRRRHQFPGAVL